MNHQSLLFIAKKAYQLNAFNNQKYFIFAYV